MNYFRTSRRDDVKSLFYLLIYLLNDCKFTGTDTKSIDMIEHDIKALFSYYRTYKSDNNLKDLAEMTCIDMDFEVKGDS